MADAPRHPFLLRTCQCFLSELGGGVPQTTSGVLPTAKVFPRPLRVLLPSAKVFHSPPRVPS
jgi:hypothetical protein